MESSFSVTPGGEGAFNPLAPIKPDEFESKHVTIDEEGKISQIAIEEKTLPLSRLIEENQETAKKLFATAQLLKEHKLGDAYDAYRGVAKKVVKLFSFAQKPPDVYASECEKLAMSLLNQAAYFIDKRREMEAIARAEHLQSEGNIATKEIFEGLLEHVDAAEFTSFGPDIFRHLMEGVVSLHEGESDLFFENDAPIFDLTDEKYTDAQAIPAFAQRLKILLNAFQSKILPPQTKRKIKVEDFVEERKRSVQDLLDKILLLKKVDHVPELIQKKVDTWRKGTENERKLATLLAPLNQIFYVTKLQNLRSLMFSDESLRDVKFSVENKKIDYQFDALKRVVANISLDFKPQDSRIHLHQQMTLSASLLQLDRWNCDMKYRIEAPEEELAKAKKLQFLIEAQGIPCELKVISD